MKKLVPCILVICLMIGLPLMVMDAIARNNVFKIPKAYEKIEIDLGEKSRENEVVFTKKLEEPGRVYFYIQSDSEELKKITVQSEKKLMGQRDSSVSYELGKITGTSSISPSLMMDSGTLTVTLSNDRAKGRLVMGYQEEPVDKADFDRLLKVDNGDLDNPPAGYEKIYSSQLTGKNCTNDVIYRIKLDKPEEIGLSIYTNAKKGKVSVDLKGSNSDWAGLIHSQFVSICDQFTQTFAAGEYEIKLTCEDADGELYIFMKK